MHKFKTSRGSESYIVKYHSWEFDSNTQHVLTILTINEDWVQSVKYWYNHRENKFFACNSTRSPIRIPKNQRGSYKFFGGRCCAESTKCKLVSGLTHKQKVAIVEGYAKKNGNKIPKKWAQKLVAQYTK